MYAIRLMIDWRVKTSVMVGRGRTGFDDCHSSSNTFDADESADVGRRSEADDSS